MTVRYLAQLLQSWRHRYRGALALPVAGVLAVAIAAVGPDRPSAAAPPAAAKPASDPCAFPAIAGLSSEETAWRIFVAATCPASGGMPLTFENWTEQSNLSASPSAAAATARHHLHGSLLAAAHRGIPSGDCGAMTGTSASPAPPSLQPFVPKNLSAGAQFCEEVFVNDSEASYVREPAKGSSLLTLTQQAAYLSGGHTIKFPKAAIEIKADWLPMNALNAPAFDCKTPTPGLYTEVIDGTCYALVGMHISSKLHPKWLWATFEPQIAATNPNRCNPKLYSFCSDSWGSSPAKSSGKSTAQTPALKKLMAGAGLAAAFQNYRLVGIQTDFRDSKMTHMGNSFVEFNAGVPAQQASCITCHSYAQLNTAVTPPVENPNFGNFPGTPAVGVPVTKQPPVPPGTWQSQDFSWLLGIQPQK